MKIQAIALLLVVCSFSRVLSVDWHEQTDPYSRTEGCGDKRGCFDCRDHTATCAVNVAWEPDMEKNVVKFTLWGSKGGNEAHVSMGITTSASMYNADVYSCISNGTSHSLVRSWNPSGTRGTEPRNLTGIRDQEVSVEDGEIRCQFYRNMSIAGGDSEFLDISGNTSYFLIISAGGLNDQGLVSGHLRTDRGISSSVVLSQLGSAGNMVMAQFGVWTLLLSLIVAFRVY